MTTTTHRRPGTIAGAGVCVLLAPLTGCRSIDNDRLSVSPEPLPALTFAETGITEAAGPSIESLDRSHWQPVTIHASADWTDHHAGATRVGPRFASATRRRNDQAPTPASALDLSADAGAQVTEGLAGPVFAGVDLVLIIPRLVVNDFCASGGTGWVAMTADAPMIDPETTGQ